MAIASTSRSVTVPLPLFVWSAGLIITLSVGASLTWNLIEQREETLDMARAQARAAYRRDHAHRRWNMERGSVYVPVTEETQPNPYLSSVPERDVETTSGMKLTLVNPAYMARQIHEMDAPEYGLRGHLTSLNPLRPANAADPWETEALEAFENGVTETSAVVELDGEPHMRYMKPLVTEQACLKCHGKQGYKVGDIRGGISVSIPMRPWLAWEKQHVVPIIWGHAVLWVLGMGGLGLVSRSLRKRTDERGRAEAALRKSDERVAKLNKLREEMLAPIALDEKLKQITEGTVDIFDADFARIWLTQPGDLCDGACVHTRETEGPYMCRCRDYCLHLHASSGRYTHTDGSGHCRIPFGHFKIGRIATGEEGHFLTNDVCADPEIHDHAWAKSLGLTAFAGCRLLSDDGEPIGVLAMFSKNHISAVEHSQLEGLAAAVSQVIQASRAEDALRRRVAFETLITEVATNFINLSADQIDAGIDRALAAIGDFSDIDRSYVFLLSDDREHISNTHEWCRDGITPYIDELQNLRVDSFTWVRDNVLCGSDVTHVARMADLPDDARAEREEFEHQGIKSIILVPMRGGDRTVGFVGFDSVRREKSWIDEDIALLRIVAGIFTNTLERKRSEVALRKQRNLLRGVIDGTDDVIFVKDREGRYVLMNAAGFRSAGKSPDMNTDTPLTDQDLFPPSVAEEFRATDLRVMKSGRRLTQENEAEEADGSRKAYLVTKYPRIDHEGTVTGVIGIARDITSRKRLEESLRFLAELPAPASDEGFARKIAQHLCESLGVRYAMVGEIADGDGKRIRTIAFCSDGEFAEAFEYDLEHTPCANVVDKRTRCYPKDVQQLFPDDNILAQLNVESYLGSPTFDATGWPLGVVVVMHDHAMPELEESLPILQVIAARVGAEIERLRIEAELVRHREHLEELVEQRTQQLEESREKLRYAERLASIGTLAAGLAHEINNPVGGILLAAENAEEARQRPGADQVVSDCLDDIVTNAQRCGDIIRSVLRFARHERSEKQLCDLNRIVRQAVHHTEDYVAHSGGCIVLTLEADLPRISVNALEIEQVFTNLIRNAVEASVDQVSVQIRTESGKDVLRVVVSDTGRGISDERLKRLFDPFFTTRLERGGTGLGLSIVHGIIEEHGATIEVNSDVGKGTTFTIEFPLPDNVSEGTDDVQAVNSR